MQLSILVLAGLLPAFAAAAVLGPRQATSTSSAATCETSYVGRFQLSIGTVNQTGTTTEDDPSDPPAAQIADGQPQVSQIVDGQAQVATASQIKDGQVQVPTAVATQISDGQVQAPGPEVSQISDGQAQAPGPQVSQITDGQPQTPSKVKRQSAPPACVSGYLTLTLSNGSLFDEDGRYGYIAGGNNQFQFDLPVQAGGYGQYSFSLCDNGTIAFNGSTNWWKCDSGAGFYNLYDAEISPDACQAAKFLAIACT